jgi:hypothetical protein
MILPGSALRGSNPDVSLTVIARESGDPATADDFGPHSRETRTMLT